MECLNFNQFVSPSSFVLATSLVCGRDIVFKKVELNNVFCTCQQRLSFQILIFDYQLENFENLQT